MGDQVKRGYSSNSKTCDMFSPERQILCDKCYTYFQESWRALSSKKKPVRGSIELFTSLCNQKFSHDCVFMEIFFVRLGFFSIYLRGGIGVRYHIHYTIVQYLLWLTFTFSKSDVSWWSNFITERPKTNSFYWIVGKIITASCSDLLFWGQEASANMLRFTKVRLNLSTKALFIIER